MNQEARRTRASFGDFQTPNDLAKEVWAATNFDDVDLLIEPTVGKGSFIATAPDEVRGVPWKAFDINPAYVEAARQVVETRRLRGEVSVQDAFHLSAEHLGSVADKSILVIGNPPWVTNSGQGGMSSSNVPEKANQSGLRGLDALTGKSNFDIAEAIILRLLNTLKDAREVRVSLLVKKSVALKLARTMVSQEGLTKLAFSTIPTNEWFGASVESGLLQFAVSYSDKTSTDHIEIRDRLGVPASITTAGFVEGKFVQDLAAYSESRMVEATLGGGLAWRQGIKHDASKILELRRGSNGTLTNGLGETVEIESELLCSFFKSSDVANGQPARRYFPLYQHDLTGPFPMLSRNFPKLHRYLESHRERLDARGSSIYKGKPPFMLFGVGEYSLSPYKVAISGFYKNPHFALLEPDESGNPPLVDDTCYLLAFDSRTAAEEVATYLNGGSVRRFLLTIADTDAKRPFTKDILGRIGLPPELAAGVCFEPPRLAI